MNKRLRKKKHLGEFRQMGFTIECQLRPGSGDRFIDDLIDIVDHDLCVGGGGAADGFGGVISSEHRYASASHKDIDTLRHWLENRTDVSSFQISGLWDMWYGRDPLNKNEPDGVPAPPD